MTILNVHNVISGFDRYQSYLGKKTEFRISMERFTQTAEKSAQQW